MPVVNILRDSLINKPDDNEPIGIILTAEKNDVFVKYATASISSNLMVAK